MYPLTTACSLEGGTSVITYALLMVVVILIVVILEQRRRMKDRDH